MANGKIGATLRDLSKPTPKFKKVSKKSDSSQQRILNFGQKQPIARCAECLMEYRASDAEDVSLHKSFHKTATDGIEWTLHANDSKISTVASHLIVHIRTPSSHANIEKVI